MILLFAACGLLAAFTIHLLWWRIKRPAQATVVLIFIFFALPLIIVPILFYIFQWQDFYYADATRIVLLYISCAFVYIILYSAIAMQSPTLAIFDAILQKNEKGYESEALKQFIGVDDEIDKRLQSMQQGGWLDYLHSKWTLSIKGKRMAAVFEYGARFFGLGKGG